MRPLLFAALVALAACAPDPADLAPGDGTPDDDLAQAAEDAAREAATVDIDVDGLAISSRLAGRPVRAITTRDGAVELGLTDSVLYSRLSKDTQAKIAADMEAEAEDREGLGGRIARAVTRAVAEGVGTAVQVPLADVRDVRVEGDRLVIEMADGEPSPFERSQSDGEPMLEQFSPADAASLAEAFGRVQAGR